MTELRARPDVTPRPSLRNHSQRATILCIAGLFVINVVVLLAVGVGVVTLATAAVILGYAWLCGFPIARAARSVLAGDGVARSGVAFLSGTVVYVGLVYVAYHLPGWGVGISLGTATWLALLALAPLATVAVRQRLWRAEKTDRPADPVLVVLCAVLSLVLSAASLYGVLSPPPSDRPPTADVTSPDSVAPRWGRPGDYRIHLIEQPRTIVQSQGFPAGPVAHRGIATMVLGLTLPTQDFDGFRQAGAAKMATGVFWFFLLYLLAFAGREGFRLDRRLTWVVAVSGAFFAPVNTPPWTLARSSYRGLFPSAMAHFHNLTQLMSVAIGLAGLVLVGLALSRRRPGLAFALGAALVGASLFFKPSLYSAAAPVVSIAWLLHPARLQPPALLGMALLAAPAGLWVLSGLLGVPSNEARIVVDAFEAVRVTGGWRFPGLPDWAVWVVVCLATFAALLPAIADRVALWLRTRQIGRDREPRGVRSLQTVLLAVLVLGMISGTFLVEVGLGAASGNAKWATGAGIVVCLPVFVAFLARTGERRLRLAAWGLLAVQVGYGVQNLYMTAWLGRI